MPGEVAAANINDGVIKNRHLHAAADIDRSKLAERALLSHVIPLTAFRVWDALQTNLPGTPASDDLGLVTGTFGSGPPLIQTGDLKAAGATTRRARALVSLPPNYNAGEDIGIRLVAAMVTTLSDTTATVDVEVYNILSDGSLSSDLVTTAAISINSGVNTYANRDFTVTPTGLNPGDLLDVRVSVAINDGAGATAVIGSILSAALRCDVKP